MARKIRFNKSFFSGGKEEKKKPQGKIKKSFFDKKKQQEREEEKLVESRKDLLFISKHSILSALKHKTLDEYITLLSDQKQREFSRIKKQWTDVELGVSVSLLNNNMFCGNYGELKCKGNVYDDVVEFSRKAAFEDNRFPPITEKDYDNLTQEIFLIDDEEYPLTYNDPTELLILLNQVKDMGLIVRKDKKEAYYLPDVWEQIPDPGMFISSLCKSADMPASAWRGDKRIWPKKSTQSKMNLYTGEIIPPEEFSGIDIYMLAVQRINKHLK